MTDKDKDILIGKMIDSPSSLTDEELRMIMLDDELKDVYDVSSAVKSAYLSQSEIDVDREWRLFRHRILPKPSPRRWMMRVAAIFLGVVMLSGILVHVIDRGLSEDVRSIAADISQHSHTQIPEIRSVVGQQDSESKTVVYESDSDVDGCMLPRKPFHSLKTVAPQTDVEEEIDVDEFLRQQQIEIEQDIDLLNAQIILDEHDAIEEFIDCISEDQERLNEAETKIII